MPRKEQYQTRLIAPDARKVDEYADKHDITHAEAIRQLVRAGLEREMDHEVTPEEIRHDLQRIADGGQELLTRQQEIEHLVTQQRTRLLERIDDLEATQESRTEEQRKRIKSNRIFTALLAVAYIGAVLSGLATGTTSVALGVVVILLHGTAWYWPDGLTPTDDEH